MPEKSGLPRLTEAAIARLTLGQTFQRGLEYYHEGNIIEPVRRGDRLQAYCQGSMPEPYRVAVHLGDQGQVEAYCTCPYDWGGICKHAVALLLTWVHEPQAFREEPPVEEVLAGYSREELVALVKEMLRREPELEVLLDRPRAAQARAGASPIDLGPYYREVAYALRRDDPADTAAELGDLAGVAERMLEEGDSLNAGSLFHLLLAEVVPAYEELYDEDGEVSAVLEDCAAGLTRCLEAGAPSPDLRKAWLEALVEAGLKDVEMGGINLAPSAREALLEQATEEEWQWIEARVREDLEGAEGWRREALVGLLAERRERAGRTGEARSLVLELGTPSQRAFQLVEMGCFEEAIALAREHFQKMPGLVDKFADALVAAGAGPAAAAYVSELVSREGPRHGYLSWLARYYQERGDLGTALQYHQRVLLEYPSLEDYRALREVAVSLGRWDELHPYVLGWLRRRGDVTLLVDIALEEDDVARALELLPEVGPIHCHTYLAKVAQAAEKGYPRQALELYRHLVEMAIAGRQRNTYREAARLLQRMHPLYRRLKAEGEWETYIRSLASQHRKLRALQDELRAAGLGS